MPHSYKEEHKFHSWRRSLTTGIWRLLGLRSWLSLPRTFRKASTRLNFLYSIKVGIAAAIAYCCAESLNLEFSLWAPMSAIIVMQVHTSASLEVSLMRFVGTTAGAILGLAVAWFMPSDIWGHVFGLLLVVPVCVFLELWEPRFRMAGMTAVLVLLLGRSVDVGVLAFALDRVLEMGLGIVSALMVSALLWPASASSQVHNAACKQLQDAAKVLKLMTASFLDHQHPVSPRLLDGLLNGIAANSQEFDRVRNYELFHIHREYPHLASYIRLMDEMRTYLSAMLDALNNNAGAGITLDIADSLQELSQATVKGLLWLAQRQEGEPQDLQPSIDAGTLRFAAVRSQGLFRNYDDAKVMQIFAFYNSLCHLAQAVSVLQGRLVTAQREKDLPGENDV